jgi:hypothetical protein
MLSYIETSSGRVHATGNPDLWRGPGLTGVQLSRAEGERRLRAQCDSDLREILEEGDTVWCVLRGVSASGMSRRIDFYSLKTGRPFWLSGYMSTALGLRRAKGQGLIVQGCGMDMGFHCVHNLAMRLFGSGYALKCEWV